MNGDAWLAGEQGSAGKRPGVGRRVPLHVGRVSAWPRRARSRASRRRPVGRWIRVAVASPDDGRGRHRRRPGRTGSIPRRHPHDGAGAVRAADLARTKYLPPSSLRPQPLPHSSRWLDDVSVSVSSRYSAILRLLSARPTTRPCRAHQIICHATQAPQCSARHASGACARDRGCRAAVG